MGAHTFPHERNNLEVDIFQKTHTLLFVRKLVLQHCIILNVCFWQMSPTINYQSVDICSFNRASGWPRYDASSIQLIQCCALPQHTVVVLFIIGAELSHNGQSCLGQLNPGSIYLGRVVTWTREGGNFFRMVRASTCVSLDRSCHD